MPWNNNTTFGKKGHFFVKYYKGQRSTTGCWFHLDYSLRKERPICLLCFVYFIPWHFLLNCISPPPPPFLKIWLEGQPPPLLSCKKRGGGGGLHTMKKHISYLGNWEKIVWSQKHNMAELFWLRHQLVLGSF